MASIRDRLQPDSLFKVIFEDSTDKPARFVLGYWSIRGLGAPLRAMLHAAQVNHEVALYDCSEASPEGWNMESYSADKKWLKEEYDPFMNLPFLVDTKRDIVVAQTNAVFQYLARELDMNGKDEIEQAKIDEMLFEAMDLREKMVFFAYQTDGSKQKAQGVMNRAKAYFDKFEAHLAKQYPDYFKTLEPKEGAKKTSDQAKKGIAHLIPGKFTAPDFHLWEMLDQFEGLCKTFDLALWADKGDEQHTAVDFQSRPDVKPEDRLYPHLEELRTNFMLLPENTHYQESFVHQSLPCNNTMAVFASDCKEFSRYTRGQEAPWLKKGVVEVRYKNVS